MNKKKQFTILSILSVIVIAVIAGYIIFVQAQSVTEDFTTETNIAATWQTTVATTTGQVTLELRDCDAGAAVWFCNASTTCVNHLGDGDYILVAQADEGSFKWKTDNSACNQPQCSQDSGQNGDNLVADNTVDFTTVYPARDACKTIGGRLPTTEELDCIQTNIDTFGGAGQFEAGSYWSSTEYSGAYAWGQGFPSGSPGNRNKTLSYYVRCVRGW